jgi:hypothetical protein
MATIQSAREHGLIAIILYTIIKYWLF